MGLLNDKDLDKYLALIGTFFACELRDKQDDAFDNETYRLFCAVREHIYTMMKNNEWVSVKEGLPGVYGKRCIVCADVADRFKIVFTAFVACGDDEWHTEEPYFMESSESDDRVNHCYRITHWMPIPEPPKEVKP